MTVPSVAMVLTSKIVTVLSRPLLVKPRPSSGAIAMPWTPGVLGMTPSDVSRIRSTTSTRVACETYSR